MGRVLFERLFCAIFSISVFLQIVLTHVHTLIMDLKLKKMKEHSPSYKHSNKCVPPPTKKRSPVYALALGFMSPNLIVNVVSCRLLLAMFKFLK